MIAIWKREVQSFFLSPIAYIFIGAFMLIAGIFFSVYNIASMSASFNSTLGTMSFVFMLVVPVLTMKLFSEERKNRTDQLLLTSPVSVWDIVLGKYLAAVTVFAVTLLISLIFPIILSLFGQPAYGEIITGYIGFFLLGSALISIGVFISSVTESQVIAAIGTFFILLLIWMGDYAISLVKIPEIVRILRWVSLYTRFDPYTVGKLSLTPTFYFISFIGIFVYLTVRNVERRRWSES